MTPVFTALMLLTGCSKSIDPGGGADTSDNTEISSGSAVIDATSESNWTYLDLETASVPTPDNPDDSPDWDMGFRRYKIKINGGVSGTGGMAVVPFFGADYNDTLEVPEDGWVTDEPDADDDGDYEYAFDTWFDYDSSSHAVSAADVVYVVRTVEQNTYKLQILDYYNDAGTAGYISLRWGPLDDTAVDDTGTDDTGEPGQACTTDTDRLVIEDQTDGVTILRADTSDEDEALCWTLADIGLAQDDWDMSMIKWTWVISGEGIKLDGQDFDALSQAPADGYSSDDGSGSVFVDWYDYDATEHVIVPKDAVYVIHTTAERYYKFQVTDYYPEDDDDHEQAHHPQIKLAEIDAPAR